MRIPVLTTVLCTLPTKVSLIIITALNHTIPVPFANPYTLLFNKALGSFLGFSLLFCAILATDCLDHRREGDKMLLDLPPYFLDILLPPFTTWGSDCCRSDSNNILAFLSTTAPISRSCYLPYPFPMYYHIHPMHIIILRVVTLLLPTL